MLTFEYGPLRVGGLATMVTDLCRHLARDRFTPVVVLPGNGLSPPWPRLEARALRFCTAERYRDGDTDVWLLRTPRLDKGPLYPEPDDLDGIRKVDDYGERAAELLPELEIDLVHMHDHYGYKSFYAARRLGLPVLYTVHRLHDEGLHLAFAEMVAVRMADEVSVVSRSYREEAAHFFAPRREVRVVQNGMDAGFWAFSGGEDAVRGRALRRRRLLARLRLPERPTFVYVGRLDHLQKGVDVLVRAWEEARVDGNLLVVGEGDAEPTELVARLAAGAPERVRYVASHVPMDEVRELFAAADVALIPSRFEPFGLILLEAMAMGALPLASRTGGLKEVLVDLDEPGGFGRLFPSGDAPALARALSFMAELCAGEPDRVAALRDRAVRRAAQHSAGRMTGEYQAIYDTLLARRGTPPAKERT
jgi:glycogen synthase